MTVPKLFQGYAHDHNLNCVMKMGGANDWPNVMDRHKKQKAIMPTWRPISTQSGFFDILNSFSLLLLRFYI